jgi:hypothetical protein
MKMTFDAAERSALLRRFSLPADTSDADLTAALGDELAPRPLSTVPNSRPAKPLTAAAQSRPWGTDEYSTINNYVG